MSTPRPAGVRASGRPATGSSSASGAGGQWPMPDRSIIGTVLGIPPVAALGVAVAFTGLGALIDVLRMGTVGVVFKIGFFLGCLLAVMWVRRRSLFGPMVQPPLLVAVLVPVIVLLVGPPRSGGGMTETLLLVGAPLINSFPTMATTTAVVLAIGIGRLLLQRYDDPELRLRRATEAPARAAAAKGATVKGATSKGATAKAATAKAATAKAARPAAAASGRIKRDGRKPGQTVADHARERAREKRLEAERAEAEAEGAAADERPAPPRDVSGRRGSGAARGEARTSRSPRQS